MDTMQLDQGDQGDPGRRPPWSGRTKRLFAISAAGAVLLGSGAVIGVALTGGASASVTPGTSANSAPAASGTAGTPASASSSTPPGSRTSRCAKIVDQALDTSHPRLASRIHALCTRPLLRLALVGGEHGEVTFNGKSGPTTIAFERGIVESDSGGAITVTAADGTTWTWAITSGTVVRQAGTKVADSAIATGEHVFVGGTVAGGAYDARLIRIARSQ
jgi:hypothetical protein